MGAIKSVRLEVTLLALGMALAATPALSQAMGPGGAGAPMAPQPRVAPAAPPVMAPQAPVVVAPMPSALQPGPTTQPRGETTNRGTTTNPGTTSPTGEPAGIKGSTAVVGLLALQTNNNSNSIFDRWGNPFAEQPGNRAAPNLSIVSTDSTRGSVAQARTDQKGLFKVPSTPGIHAITLPANDIEAAYIKIVEIKGDQSPEAPALRGGFIIPAIAIIAFKVPGTTTGGGRQDFGLARAIPRGAPAMQVKLAVNNDGTVSTVDWNDGAGPQSVSREGKPIGTNNGTGEIVARTLFVGEAPKKQ